MTCPYCDQPMKKTGEDSWYVLWSCLDETCEGYGKQPAERKERPTGEELQ